MLLADLGTSYTKIFDTEKKEYSIIESYKVLSSELYFNIGCGHNAKIKSKQIVNELVALKLGSSIFINEPDFILVDVGSRDIKYLKIKNHRYEKMDWNIACGATLGFSIELLSKYFNIDFAQFEKPVDGFNIICGILGLAEMFDRIAEGMQYKIAIAKYVKGIANNIYRFIGEPYKFYLSGGLCENKLFLQSFDCEVIPLGRFVLLEGLKLCVT